MNTLTIRHAKILAFSLIFAGALTWGYVYRIDEGPLYLLQVVLMPLTIIPLVAGTVVTNNAHNPGNWLFVFSILEIYILCLIALRLRRVTTKKKENET